MTTTSIYDVRMFLPGKGSESLDNREVPTVMLHLYAQALDEDLYRAKALVEAWTRPLNYSIPDEGVPQGDYSAHDLYRMGYWGEAVYLWTFTLGDRYDRYVAQWFWDHDVDLWYTDRYVWGFRPR